MSQGKSKTMPMQIFLGVEAVYLLRYKHIGYVIKPDTKSRLGIAPSSVVKHVTLVWLKIKMVVLLMSVF